MWSCGVVLSSQVDKVGLLGSGPDCPSSPYRGVNLTWPAGCPPSLPCCSEYGYCHSLEEWATERFRDCNGISNGIQLPEKVVRWEANYAKVSASS